MSDGFASSRAAGIPWQVLAQQVVMGPTRLPSSARAAQANLVVLTGESHNGWAYELRSAGGAAGVEYAGQSVASLGIEKRFGGDPARIAADFLAANPALKWADTHRRGYMVLTLTRDRFEADYVFLPSRNERSTRLLGTQKLVTEREGNAVLRG